MAFAVLAREHINIVGQIEYECCQKALDKLDL